MRRRPRLRKHLSRSDELESRYGSDAAMGVCLIGPDGDGESQLPNGRAAVICTNCADWVRAHEPDTHILGWPDGSNPTATVTSGYASGRSGHDFAIVADRYIVDPWAKETACTTSKAVFDLADSNDLVTVRSLYGDPTDWEKSSGTATEPGPVLSDVLRKRLGLL